MNDISNLLSNRPSFLVGVPDPGTNAAAVANLPASFAVMSIRNREWSIRFRGESEALKQTLKDANGRDVQMPVRELPVVIVAASQWVSKTFYLKGFDGAEQ